MKIRLLILSIVALCLSTAPAMADLSLYFDIHSTELSLSDLGDNTYSGVGGVSSNPETASAVAAYLLQDGYDILGQTSINPLEDGMFAFDLTFTGTGENWTAFGSLNLQDTAGDAVKADIFANDISITHEGLFYELEISGRMFTQSGEDSILLASGAWTYAGDSGSIGLSDGAENWDSGAVVIAHYLLPSGVTSLSTLFSYVTNNDPTLLAAGNVELTIVPVPAAVILGILGLGVVGIKLRKYA